MFEIDVILDEYQTWIAPLWSGLAFEVDVILENIKKHSIPYRVLFL